MESKFLEIVLEHYRKNDWKSILKLNEKSDNPKALKILWAWPEESNLFFLKYCLERYNIQGIMSIGCGCGLLEWIIEKCSGVRVSGYEVNKEWWESKYSNPCFIPLNFVENISSLHFNDKFALMFCYFNNGEAFREYINRYNGEMVIIIGPGYGSGRHTDPQPFNPNFGHSCWHLGHFQQLKDTKDFIAIYLRFNISQLE